MSGKLGGNISPDHMSTPGPQHPFNSGRVIRMPDLAIQMQITDYQPGTSS